MIFNCLIKPTLALVFSLVFWLMTNSQPAYAGYQMLSTINKDLIALETPHLSGLIPVKNNQQELEVKPNGYDRLDGLIQKDLFFGCNVPGEEEVCEEDFEEDFAEFVDSTITPHFPDGLTIFDAQRRIFEAEGKFPDGRKTIIEEPSKVKVVTLFIEDTPTNEMALDEIVRAYLQQFNQGSIWQVTNKDELKIGFELPVIIDSDPTPELIAADLFFGRNIPGGGQVSEKQFAEFVDSTITPRFPDGLTIFDADGQFRQSPTDPIIEEPSKVVTIVFEDTQDNENALDEIIEFYIEEFNQQSVLWAVNEDIAVRFVPNRDPIDNDPTPELIAADLFFGRNIPGGGQVSEKQFAEFVDSTITPRFPDRLTIFDADGQFRNGADTIIKEPSKVVTIVFKDTQDNENALDEIMESYIQQFNQESVLLVVDEDLEVAFKASRIKYSEQHRKNT